MEKNKPRKGDEPVCNLEAYVKTFDASAEGATPISKLLGPSFENQLALSSSWASRIKKIR
jgi:hypothetical protein